MTWIGGSCSGGSGTSPRSVAIDLVTYEEGHARGVRALQVNTGGGLRFSVHPDRGMDVGRAEFAGIGLAYLAPNMAPGPWYYEGKLDDYAWLRVGLGGLVNTAGLVTIGVPQTISTEQYGFTQRMTERYGTHGRIAVTPATRFTHGETWSGDRCTLWIEGLVREEIAYGENLSLHRRYEAELGSRSFRMTDVVTNDGWFETPHQLLYHTNIGYPIVDAGSEILAATTAEPADMSFTTRDDGGSSSRWRTATDPEAGFTHEGYVVSMRPDGDGEGGRRGRQPAPAPRRGRRRRVPALRPAPAPRLHRLADDARGPLRGRARAVHEPLRRPRRAPRAGLPLSRSNRASNGRYETEFGILLGAGEIDAFANALPS